MELYQIFYGLILLFILVFGILSKDKIKSFIVPHKWIDFPDQIRDLISESIKCPLYFENDCKYILFSIARNQTYRLSFKLRESIIDNKKVLSICLIINFFEKKKTKQFFCPVENFSDYFQTKFKTEILNKI
jgi:hypothetical protein